MTGLRAVAAAVVLALCGWLVGSAQAAADTPVALIASVNGVQVGTSSLAHPVRLDPAKPAELRLTIINNSSNLVTVHRVQLSARVLGLTFYSFDTSVGLDVPAGTIKSLNYSLELTGLRGQATGLMNGSLTLFDAQDHAIASQSSVTDVRGSWQSVYGLFGFALLLLTILALLDVALSIARHRMPANRFRRGARVMTPGIGIGLVLVFTLSAVRVWVPTTQRWLVFAAGFAVVFFLLGYFSPTPAGPEDLVEADEAEEASDGAEADAEVGVVRMDKREWSDESNESNGSDVSDDSSDGIRQHESDLTFEDFEADEVFAAFEADQPIDELPMDETESLELTDGIDDADDGVTEADKDVAEADALPHGDR